MSKNNFVRPLPIYEQTLQRLQWDGKYWGEYGALEYARRNSDLVNLTRVGLISLRYGAATSAWARWRKTPFAFWWLLRAVFCFYPAFNAAREFVQAKQPLTLTPEECSVVGMVLVRGKLRDLGIHVLEHGLSQLRSQADEVKESSTSYKFETAALLYANLYEVHAMPIEKVWMFVWGYTHAPNNLEQVKKPSGKIAPGQLCLVLQKIGLSDFAELYEQEQEVWDQVAKSRA